MHWTDGERRIRAEFLFTRVILFPRRGNVAMSDNKDLVTAFFQAINKRGFEAISKFAADDMTWWGAGRRVEVGVDEFIAMVSNIQPLFAEPMKFQVQHMIAEGDYVAAEVENYAPLKNGRIYSNKYHFKFVINDGKIARVLEYHDTKHAYDIFRSDGNGALSDR